jgi:hypothetical protein
MRRATREVAYLVLEPGGLQSELFVPSRRQFACDAENPDANIAFAPAPLQRSCHAVSMAPPIGARYRRRVARLCPMLFEFATVVPAAKAAEL